MFCLLNQKVQDTLDPLKLEQWDFYVLPARVLDAEMGNARSLSLVGLKKLKPLHVGFGDLKQGVERVIKIIEN